MPNPESSWILRQELIWPQNIPFMSKTIIDSFKYADPKATNIFKKLHVSSVNGIIKQFIALPESFD